MSGILLSGRLAAIKANIDTLLTRLTSTRAAFLDAAISSRAAASTALSNITWSGAKAAFLDVGISSRASASALTTVDTVVDAIKVLTDLNLDAKISEVGVSPPTTISALTFPEVNGSEDISAFSVPQSSAVNNSGVWNTNVSVTGKGRIQFLEVGQQSNTSSRNVQFRLLIDAVEVWISDASAWTDTGDNGDSISVIGAAFNTVVGGVAFGNVPFNTSFKTEWKNNSAAASITMRTHHRYTLES